MCCRQASLLELVCLAVLAILSSPSNSYAQDPVPPTKTSATASSDDTYNAQRKFAIDLFQQNHHLEALPIFQQLAKQKPDDNAVIFGWGACLLDHSATLTDDQAAKEERIQARKLLVRAKELGNNNQLLLNLLEMLPEDGGLVFDKNTEVDKAIRDGEAAFAKNDYDTAIVAYTRAYTLDPKQYHAILFIGDAYFSKKDFSNATVWYDRAIQLDPNIDAAYRYEADMLIRNGEMEKARTRAIQAVIAVPYSNVTWRSLIAWADANHVKLTPVRINAASGASAADDKHIKITIDPSKGTDSSSVWLGYQMSRALWQMETFKKTLPSETQYRHSLAEEADSLKAAASVAESNSKKSKNVATADPDIALLVRIYDAKMIEPYVLLSAPDQGIAADYVAYRERHREQLEQYLSQFIVPAAPAPAKH